MNTYTKRLLKVTDVCLEVGLIQVVPVVANLQHNQVRLTGTKSKLN